MGPKKISDQQFKGTQSLTHEQWRDLQIDNRSDAPRRMMDKWSGNVIGFLACYLSNDATKVDQMVFTLAGDLFTDFNGLRCPANKFFEIDDSYSIEIPPFESALFTFHNGTMQSEILDHSKIRVDWFKDGVALTAEERAAAKIPGFSLRFFATPNAANWMAISIILFPLPKQQLLELYPMCLHPAFPGIRLYSAAHCVLGFDTKQVFPDLCYGSPLLPCVLSASDWHDNPTNPSTNALLFAMAKTLRTATSPTAKKDPANLKKRYEEILLQGEASLKPNPPSHLWPLPAEPPSTTPIGRDYSPFFLLLMVFQGSNSYLPCMLASHPWN